MPVSSEPHLATLSQSQQNHTWRQCQSHQNHTLRAFDSLIRTTHYDPTTVSSEPHTTLWQSYQNNTLRLYDSLIRTKRGDSMAVSTEPHVATMPVSSEPHVARLWQSHQNHTLRPYDSFIRNTYYDPKTVSSEPHITTLWQSHQNHTLRPYDSLIIFVWLCGFHFRAFCSVMHCSLFPCFCLSILFSILINLLWEERAGLYVPRACVYFARVNCAHVPLLVSGCGLWLRLSLLVSGVGCGLWLDSLC